MWTLSAVATLTLPLLAGALAGISGQEPEPSLTISPRIGTFHVERELYNLRFATSADITAYSHAQLSNGRSIGVTIDWGSPERGVHLRLAVDRSIDVYTRLALGEVGQEIGTFAWIYPELSTSVTEFGLDVVLPLRLRLGPVEPFVFAGVGLTRYRFEEAILPPQALEVWSTPASGTSSSIRLGGGLRLSLIGQVFSLTATSASGPYWDVTRRRLLVHLGVELRVPFVG